MLATVAPTDATILAVMVTMTSGAADVALAVPSACRSPIHEEATCKVPDSNGMRSCTRIRTALPLARGRWRSHLHAGQSARLSGQVRSSAMRSPAVSN